MAEVTFHPGQRDSLGRRFGDALPPWPICALALLIGLVIPGLLLQWPMLWIIGGAVGVIALLLAVASPFFGMVLFLGLLYLRPEEYFPALAGARMTLIVSLTAMFAWIVNACLSRERFQFHLPVVGCFLGFLTVAIGSTAACGAGSLGEVTIELLKLLIMFVLIVHLINSEERLRKMAGAVLLFTVVLGARTVWQYQNGQAMYTSEGDVRALSTGIFSDPNDLALAMAMALPLVLATLFGKARSWTKGWNLVSVPILIWCIFVTDSRGGMLALGAAVMSFFGRRLGRVGMLVGVIAVVGLFVFGPSRLSKMSSDEESAQGRVAAWEAGMGMLASQPIWGVGKGQFTEHHQRTAHNSLVLCLAECGFAGTVLWLGIFYFAFRDTKTASLCVARQEREAAALAGQQPPCWGSSAFSIALQGSLITFAVGGFFLSRTYTPPLYVYLAMAVAAARVELGAAGQELPGSEGGDWLKIGGITIAGWLLIQVLIRLWG
jgi:O-antigen ligase